MTLSVIIVTLNRPDCVRRCLKCLAEQQPTPDQIIVVDASAGDATELVVASYPSAFYIRNPNGIGRMTASRNIGLAYVTGDVIAFLDDDAFAHQGWSAALLGAYGDSSVGAVGGRALNEIPGESIRGVENIGKLTRNGSLEGWFGADPGSIVAVDHIIGCNMSFRRSVLAELGGFREDYPGISGLREDSDMSLRITALNYRILFVPEAIVTHIGAPQVNGSRFDVRYAYYSQRNHVTLLLRNFGLNAPIVWRYLLCGVFDATCEFFRRIAAAVARCAVFVAGTVTGAFAGLGLIVRLGKQPRRTDEKGQAIRLALGQSGTDSSREKEYCQARGTVAVPLENGLSGIPPTARSADGIGQ